MKDREVGHSLIELVMALSLTAVLAMGSGAAILSGVRSNGDLADQEQIFNMARSLLTRTSGQPFGLDTDPAPAVDQVVDLLLMEGSISTVTLNQLANSVPDGRWDFILAGFPVPGTWSLRVSPDLDQDGSLVGTMETSGEVFLITISFDDREIIRTVRSADA